MGGFIQLVKEIYNDNISGSDEFRFITRGQGQWLSIKELDYN